MSEHTDGPWWFDEEIAEVRSQGKRIAHIRLSVDAPVEYLANGNLIAAAPDLLAACKAALRLDYFNEHNALAKQMREAVEKAGEASDDA